MSVPDDQILYARPTIDLEALEADSNRGLASMWIQGKNVRANAREKKRMCGNPDCDHEEEDSAPLRACSKCQYVLYFLPLKSVTLIVWFFSSVRYCSVACQHAHWKAHKKPCSSFSNLPFYRDFDPTLILPGCRYPQSPIFASGHQDGFGCWITPGGQITGE